MNGWNWRRTGTLLLGLLYLLPGAPLRAQEVNPESEGPGTIDTRFQAPTVYEGTFCVAELPSGELLVGNRYYSFAPQDHRPLRRLAADGAEDSSFAPELPAEASVSALHVTEDGRILVIGASLHAEPNLRADIVRLHANGSRDRSFNPGPHNGMVEYILPLPGGQLLVRGTFQEIGGGSRSGIARLHKDGSLDASFTGAAGSSGARAIARQADGKYVLAGPSGVAGHPTVGLSRLYLNGDVDPTFQTGTGFNDSWTNVYQVAVLPDGKILAAGTFHYNNGWPPVHLLRFHPDGRADSSFIEPLLAESAHPEVTSMRVLRDGRILLTGRFDTIGGVPWRGLARLQSTGLYDASFVPPEGTYPLLELASGDLLAPPPGPGVNRPALIKLRGGDAPEPFLSSPQFAYTSYRVSEGAGTASILVRRLGTSSDAHVVSYRALSGTAEAGVHFHASPGVINFGPGETVKFLPIQLIDNPDGHAARSFILKLHDPQTGQDIAETSVFIDDDEQPGYFDLEAGAYSVRESAGSVTIRILREGGSEGAVTLAYAARDGANRGAQGGHDFTASAGSLTFEEGETEKSLAIPIVKDGVAEGDENFMLAISLPSNGGILGTTTVATITILDSDDPGSFVESFAPVFEDQPYIGSIVVQQDGKVITAGHRGLTRFNLEGSVDPSFPGTGTWSVIRDMIGLPDGRFYVVGDFFSDERLETAKLARFKADGTLDASFAPVQRPNGRVDALGVQRDGSLIVLGNFSAVGTTKRLSLARFRPDGTFDSTFAPAGTSYGTLLLVDRQDRVYHSTAERQIRRISAAGEIDTAFSTQISGVKVLNGMTFDEEQRLVIWGAFGAVNQYPYARIARLQENGSVDTSTRFNDSTLRFAPDTVLVQPDGRFLVAGLTGTHGITRYWPDGRVDPSFKTILGGHVYAMALGAEHDLVFAGDFSSVDGVPQRYLARVALGANAGRFRYAPGTLTEVEETAGVLRVKVQRQGGSEGDATVRYVTTFPLPVHATYGSATSGEDFVHASGELAFADGETEKEVFVEVVNDGIYEHPEQFRLYLSDAQGSFLSGHDGDLVITIHSDDPRQAGFVGFEVSSVQVAEEAGEVTVTVTRTGGDDEAAGVKYRTLAGSAHSGTDFAETSGTLLFEGGVAERTITIPLVDSRFPELLESFQLLLFDPEEGLALGSGALCSVSILDTDTDAFAAFRGNYSASVASSDGFKGLVTLKVTSQGAATGVINWMGRKLSLRQRFDESGLLHVALPVPGVGSASLTISLGTAGNLDQVTGSLEIDGVAYPLGFDRAVYHASRNPFPGAGRYAVRYSPIESGSGGPIGHGYAVGKVTAGGAVRFVGALADGTPFTHSAVVGENGAIALFSRLYEGKGMIAGSIAIDTDAGNAVSGTATWVRPEISAKSGALVGFSTPLEVRGSPVIGDAAAALPLGGKVVVFGRASAALELDIVGVDKRKILLMGGDDDFLLSLDSKTGVFTGKLRDTGGSLLGKVQGVLLQNEQGGAGFFLSPAEFGGVWIGTSE
ncbi:MAG: Calx-beta domain-containing protein [Chthoniobacteraceae bacterium]